MGAGSVIRAAVIIAVGAVILRFLPDLLRPKLPSHFRGEVAPGFEVVEEVFRSNYVKGWEVAGSSFAAYHKGKLVAHLWGGYADVESKRKWTEDTITCVYSTTKSIAALSAAVLVDRGYMKWDDLMVKYWPEFGANGKDNVTVLMYVSHQAGLAVFDAKLTADTIRDRGSISKIMEIQKPNWPPGSGRGYHGLTYGFLIDQLVSRVDPKHRNLSTFFKEEYGKSNFDLMSEQF